MHDGDAAGSREDGGDTLVLIHEARKKRVGLAYALWLALGIGGGHRFYIGGRGTRYGWVLWGLSLPLALLWHAGHLLPLDETVVGLSIVILVGPWILDAVLTYFAVRNRNRALLAEARAQQKLQVQVAPSGHSTPMQLAAVVLSASLFWISGSSEDGDGAPAADQTTAVDASSLQSEAAP